jgi:hypothetical protein
MRLIECVENFLNGVKSSYEFGPAKIDGTTLRGILEDWDYYELLCDNEEIIDDLLDVVDALIHYFAARHEVELYEEAGHLFAQPEFLR